MSPVNTSWPLLGQVSSINTNVQQVQQAVETLRDPELRRQHDAILEAELAPRHSWVAPAFSQKQTDCDEWTKEECPRWKPSAHYQFESTDPWGRYAYSHGESVHMNPNAPFAKEEAARHENDLDSWESEYAGVDPEVEKAQAELLQEEMRARFKRKEEEEKKKARAEMFYASQGTMRARARLREKEQKAKAEKHQEALHAQFEAEKANAVKLQEAMRALLERQEKERKAKAEKHQEAKRAQFEEDKAKVVKLQEAMRALLERQEKERKAKAKKHQKAKRAQFEAEKANAVKLQEALRAIFERREEERKANAEKFQEAKRAQFEAEKANVVKLQEALRALLARREEERKAAEEAVKGINTDDDPFVYWAREYHSPTAFADSDDNDDDDSAYSTGSHSTFVPEPVEDFEYYRAREEPRQEQARQTPAGFEYYQVREESRQEQAHQTPAGFQQYYQVREEPRQEQARQKPTDFEYYRVRQEPRQQDADFSYNAHFAATAEPVGQKSPLDDVKDMPQVHANILEAIKPLLPYYEAKLKNTRHHYTANEVKEELQGLILEAHSIWANEKRAVPKADMPGPCGHGGIWRQEFNCPRCEKCDIWRPLLTLTCPTCGMKACVRCKYS